MSSKAANRQADGPRRSRRIRAGVIRARTGESRKRAQERGVKFGRPRKLTAHQRQEAIARLSAGETQADVARTYNVDPTTIGRLQ
jgi:DNA invertase Pin-like site-specific DNA recombinase